MKTTTILPMIAALILLSLVPAKAQRDSSDMDGMIQSWLLKTSAAPDEGQLMKLMSQNPSAAEKILMNAIKNGPDGNVLNQVSKNAAIEFENTKGVSGITKERFMYQQVDRLICDYRAEAQMALGFVRSKAR